MVRSPSIGAARRLRAALAIALLWALAWLPIGVGLALYAGSRPPDPSDVIRRPVELPLFIAAWTTWGGISGGLFAVVLGLTERRRRIEDLSPARTAVWGAIGAMTLPTVLTLVDLVRYPPAMRGDGWSFPVLALAVSAALGAACAAATIAVARR